MATKRAGRAKKQAASAESKAAPAGESPASTGTAATTKAAPRRRTRRIKAKRRATARRVKRVGRPPKQSRRGKRYTPAQRARILAVARKEQLTGEQVSKRFGVSTLSFYTWRKKAGSAAGRRKKAAPLRRAASQVAASADGIIDMIRREVRAQLERLTPQIIQSEVGRALGVRPGGSR